MMDKIYALMAKKDAMLASDEGATAVEYGIMVAAIAAVIIAIVITLGGQVDAAFQKVSTALGGIASGS